MNPALLATFLSLFCALLIIRSLQKQLAIANSDLDCADAISEARNRRIDELTKQAKDWMHESDRHVADYIELQEKYDRLLGEKTQLEAMNTALKIELKRKHRRTRVQA